MLDSAVVENASKARPTARNAIEWARTAWNELSVGTVKNCWNHAKILPRPVTSGAVDGAIDELKALLIEFAMSQSNGRRNLSLMTRVPQLHMLLVSYQIKRRPMTASR